LASTALALPSDNVTFLPEKKKTNHGSVIKLIILTNVVKQRIMVDL